MLPKMIKSSDEHEAKSSRRSDDKAKAGDAEWERLVPAIQARRAQGKAAVLGYEKAVAEISSLLFAADPIGINFETNSDACRQQRRRYTNGR